MITVKRLVCNMLQENTYIVSDETREAVIIDCGAYYDAERTAIVNYLTSNQLKPVHLLCTHGHFDHNFGNDTIWHTFGLKPEVAAEDEGMMELKTMFKELTGADYLGDIPPVGRLLATGECIHFGTHQLKVLPTPGHSRGSVTFYCEAEHAAFTGDTLFRMSIGRTDFEGGSWSDMSHSLKKVLAILPADTMVYPGHGEPTTIGYELQYNPYMH